jgi:zinc protease
MPIRRSVGLLTAPVLALFLALPATPTMAFEIESVETPGGIAAWLVEDHSAPIVSISFAFRGGSAADPQGKEGLARFVSAMLDEGAGDLDAEAFQNRIADLSIDLEFDAGRDEFSGTIRMLNESRDEAVGLLKLALSEPRFDADAVERIRSQILSGIARSAADPGEIASRVFRETAFPDHVYGREQDGTAETVALLDADDLRGFVARSFARDNLVVGAVGDIDASTLGAVLDRLFADLPATADLPVIPETTPLGAGQTILVDRDIPQSVVMFGSPGMKRDDPDFYVGSVLMEAVGGGFGARLTEEVREKRGLAYSVGANLVEFEHAGAIFGQAGTRNERVAETVAIVKDLFRDVAENGLPQDEIDDARDYIVGSYPLRWTSSRSTAGALVSIQLAGLPIDYVESRDALFGAVTQDDIRRVAADLLDPAKLLVVVVGRPDGIEGDPPAN